MSNTKRVHVAYLVSIVALLSLGATFAARSYMAEIGPSATVTGPAPEIRFLDNEGGAKIGKLRRLRITLKSRGVRQIWLAL